MKKSKAKHNQLETNREEYEDSTTLQVASYSVINHRIAVCRNSKIYNSLVQESIIGQRFRAKGLNLRLRIEYAFVFADAHRVNSEQQGENKGYT